MTETTVNWSVVLPNSSESCSIPNWHARTIRSITPTTNKDPENIRKTSEALVATSQPTPQFFRKRKAKNANTRLKMMDKIPQMMKDFLQQLRTFPSERCRSITHVSFNRLPLRSLARVSLPLLCSPICVAFGLSSMLATLFWETLNETGNGPSWVPVTLHRLCDSLSIDVSSLAWQSIPGMAILNRVHAVPLELCWRITRNDTRCCCINPPKDKSLLWALWSLNGHTGDQTWRRTWGVTFVQI